MKAKTMGLGGREYATSFIRVKEYLDTQNGRDFAQVDAEAMREDLVNVFETFKSVQSFNPACTRVTLSKQVRSLLRMLGYSV